MRMLRVSHQGSARFARWVDAGQARLWSAAPWAGGQETEETVPLGGELLPPVTPTKIVCVGRNYRKHAEELGNEVPSVPLLFLKPPSALLPSGGTVRLPPESERVDFEGEIAVVIGERMNRDTEGPPSIFGITCANDVTARDLQRRDVQFTRGKSFDTFLPCGPWIETEFALDDLTVRTTVDGSVMQTGHANQMIWSINELLRFIASIMTLEPGDLVLTGTPEGVGPLQAGQSVTIDVRGVGQLTHSVAPV